MLVLSLTLFSVAWDAASLLLVHNVVTNPVHAILWEESKWNKTNADKKLWIEIKPVLKQADSQYSVVEQAGSTFFIVNTFLPEGEINKSDWSRTWTPSPDTAEQAWICHSRSRYVCRLSPSAISLAGDAVARSCLLAKMSTGTPFRFSSSISSDNSCTHTHTHTSKFH